MNFDTHGEIIVNSCIAAAIFLCALLMVLP